MSRRGANAHGKLMGGQIRAARLICWSCALRSEIILRAQRLAQWWAEFRGFRAAGAKECSATDDDRKLHAAAVTSAQTLAPRREGTV